MSFLRRMWSRQRLRNWQRLVTQVQAEDASYAEFSDSQLQKASLSLRYRALSGELSQRLLVPAFGLVRQAARRTLGMSHYPVQILGGIALHHGAIAVMQTGEGKTLTATLPLYLAALSQHGAQLITANDYLAQRDSELMRPLYELLGLRVGVVTAESTHEQRRTAYAADITYSTAKEIGFDFLRDRIAQRLADELPMIGGMTNSAGGPSTVQREFHFALIDEADSILIDEARTPLIVSSPIPNSENPRASLYRWAAAATAKFQTEVDYSREIQHRRVQLTSAGRRKTRQLPRPNDLATIPLLELYQFIEQAITVEQYFQDGRQYLIKDDEVQIVDEFTGRVADGRKWRSGLHQAIEARHHVKVTHETGEAARVTVQDLFLRYPRLAGMTGTVAASGPELHAIYKLWTVDIPTNRPPKRARLPDRVCQTSDQKWDAIAEDVERIHRTGRPVLVGTRSIELSRRLAERLRARQIPHQVLNATHAAAEAEIVALAGQVGAVTVATNMAGRGTDIKLSLEAFDVGGLHVICSELHESARIDRQLIGRCGRQGDPGSYQHFHCWEDDILVAGFGKRAEGWRAAIRQGVIVRGDVSVFRRAQRKVERRHFKARRQLLFHEGHRQQLQREMGQDPYLDTIES
ncbi:MAG: preprotein translocase subunit SecA [Pirellulaceae bacterium]|nr:preprotein translocase subunit SecA [Pirellulaceae bacterium]